MQEILEWLDSKRSYDEGVKLYLKYGKDPLLHKLFQEEYSEFKLKKLHTVLEQLAGPAVDTVSPKISTSKPGLIISPAEVIVPAANIQEIKNQVTEIIEEKEAELRWQIDDLEDEQYNLRKQVDTINNDQEKLQEDVKKLQVAQKGAPRGWPPSMDETLRGLHDQWHPLFVEKKSLQARIYDLALLGQKDPLKKKEAGAMAHRILDLRDACREIYKRRDHYLVNGEVLQEPKLLDIPDDPKKWPITLQNYERYARQYRNKLAKIAVTEANQTRIENFKKQLAKYEWGVNELKNLLK